MIGGVCGGIGEYFNTDPTLIRLIWVAITALTGFVVGIVAYVVCWAIIPEEPGEGIRKDNDKEFILHNTTRDNNEK